jgi:integrase
VVDGVLTTRGLDGELAGMGPGGVSGHSMRAGSATAAAAAGVQERVIAQITGHESMTVLRRYIREGNVFNENAAAVGREPFLLLVRRAGSALVR